MEICLNDHDLAALVEQRSTRQELARLQHHVAACPPCLQLVIAVAGSYFADVGWSKAIRSGAGSPDASGSFSELIHGGAWTPPRMVDEFRIIRPLGRGAMGQVFIAHDTLLERVVAIKFVAGMEPDDDTRRRFLHEARAIARLQHPNVVSIYTVGEHEGRPYLVSEYVQGTSLDLTEKPLSRGVMLSIARDLARGLAAAHRQGVLHRDLKPANAILAKDGQAKLLDFGLAKLLGTQGQSPIARAGGPSVAPESISEGPVHTLTATGMLLGTPLYLAPEIWAGEPASRASDLYSLGALLYELVAGQPPRTAATLREIKQLALRDDVIPLASVAPEVDPTLAAIIDRCLCREPEARYATVDDFCHALAQLEQPDLSLAIPAGNPYRGLHPFEAQHRALFFGRSSEIDALIERLRSEPLVLLAGDSGVGKSSLCYAGVLPRITEGALGERRAWSVLKMVPGRRPLSALGEALATSLQLPEESSTALLRDQPADLARLLRQRLGDQQGVLLFIDQMEELVTQSEAQEAELFSRAFSRLTARLPGFRVLGAVRGDFLTRLAALPGLEEDLVRATHLLRSLSSEAMRQAIVGPARLKGVRFESDALINELLDSSADGGLPLLQFALSELWDARDTARQMIPASGLRAIGGVTGALSRHADTVVESLRPAQRDTARRILSRLVTADDTRSRRREDELLSDAPSERGTLDALVRGRLLVAREGESGSEYEVAHEALIKAWPLLRSWLSTEGERRVALQRLEQAVREWHRLEHAKDTLWGEKQLREFAATAVVEGTLGERERQFLADSRNALVRRKRLTRLALYMAAGLAAALALLAFVSWRSRDAARRSQELAQREAGLRAQSYSLQPGREREALKSAIEAVGLAMQENPKALPPATLAGLRAAVHVGRQSLPLVGHRKAVRWAAFSPDSTRVATLDEDEQVRIWEPETGRLIAALEHRGLFAYRLFFTPDGRHVIAPLLNGEIRIWQSDTGALVATLNGKLGAVSHVAFSPDGKRLAVTGGMSSRAAPEVQVWDRTTYKQLLTLRGHTRRVEWVDYSPDGRLLVSAGWDQTARLYDAESGRKLAILAGHEGPIEMSRFSPDGRLVLTGSRDGTARLWDVPSGALRSVLRGHIDEVWWASFTPNGHQILTAGQDGTARVWDTRTGVCRFILNGHNAVVRTAVATPDGRRVLTAGHDKLIRVWSLRTGSLLAVLAGHSGAALFAFPSPNGAYIASGGLDPVARIWSGAAGTFRNTVRGTHEYLRPFLSKDGRYLVAHGTDSAEHEVLDGLTGEPIASLTGHKTYSVVIGLSADGEKVFTLGAKAPDRSLRVFRTRTGEQLATLRPADSGATLAWITADGSKLMIVDDDHKARLIDAESGTPVRSIELRPQSPSSGGLSADASYFAAGYEDGGLQLFDLRTGRTLIDTQAHQQRTYAVDFAPDGQSVFTTGYDGNVRSWSLPAARPGPSFSTGARLAGVVVSPDSKSLVTLSDSSLVYLWDARTGKLHWKREGHTNWLIHARFSNDGRRLLTASYDGTARIWDVTTGVSEIVMRGHEAYLNAAEFTPDGLRIVTTSGDATLRFWDVRSGEPWQPPDLGRMLMAFPAKSPEEWERAMQPGSMSPTEIIEHMGTACRLLRYQPEYPEVGSICHGYRE